MKTELLEREISKILSILRIAKDQKISEFPKLAKLLNEQVEFLDEDLQLFIRVLKSEDGMDLMKILLSTRMMKKGI